MSFGIECVERVPIQAPSFERARTEVLDQDVGRLGKVAAELLALRGSQVDGDTALVASSDLPPDTAPWRVADTPLAQHVPGPRGLHLDDVGAEVAEQLTAERTGDHLPEFDDADAGERSGGRGLRGHPSTKGSRVAPLSSTQIDLFSV